MAEFVDYALQSYLDYQQELTRLHGQDFRIKVTIDLRPVDGGQIVIRDNAAGIHEQDFPRAFRTAAVPLNATGLSEFGMGMKSAACWFASKWSVKTTALGEQVERTVNFDVDAIVRY